MRPQTPQLFGSVPVFAQSDPHSVSPAAHPQVPPEHVRGATHAGAPHDPQWAGSVARFTHVPVALQYVSPAAHAQTPALHDRGDAHGIPQPPQFAGSMDAFTQTPPQRMLPGLPPHGTPHAPPEQVIPAVHAIPHAPQFAASDPSATSHPLDGTWSQSPNPARHVRTHALDTHDATALAPPPGHARAHAPQFSASLARLDSHPSTAEALQFAKTVPHAARVHTPATHAPKPFGGAHACPHAPQFDRLVESSVSQPFDGSPSQFANPALHAPITHAPVEHVAPAFAN